MTNNTRKRAINPITDPNLYTDEHLYSDGDGYEDEYEDNDLDTVGLGIGAGHLSRKKKSDEKINLCGFTLDPCLFTQLVVLLLFLAIIISVAMIFAVSYWLMLPATKPAAAAGLIENVNQKANQAAFSDQSR